MNAGYIKSLDGVRAVAILLVMTFHADIIGFGWIGVQLFFVLSGFLITGILWKEKFTEGSLSSKFKKFWIRRSLRIFPLYFAYLFIWVFTYLLLKFPSYFPNYSPYLFSYTINFTRTLPEWQGNPLFTHLWSLSIEEQFYLVFPFIMFLLPPRFLKFFLVVFIVLSPVIRFLLGEYYYSKGHGSEVVADAIYWNTLSHMDAFFIGGIIQVFALDKIKKVNTLFIFCLTLLLAAGLLSYVNNPDKLFYLTDLGYAHGQAGNYEYVWHYTLLNFAFASFILLLLSKQGDTSSFLKKMMEAKWITRIGRVSYGMYVFHWLVWVYIFERILPAGNMMLRIVYFIPYCITVYLLAELSYNLFEKRFLLLKDKLYTKRKTIEEPGLEKENIKFVK